MTFKDLFANAQDLNTTELNAMLADANQATRCNPNATESEVATYVQAKHDARVHNRLVHGNKKAARQKQEK